MDPLLDLVLLKGHDNIDHNTQTLDGLNTFHGIRMIKAVSPGVNIPCVDVTADDVAVASWHSLLQEC